MKNRCKARSKRAFSFSGLLLDEARECALRQQPNGGFGVRPRIKDLLTLDATGFIEVVKDLLNHGFTPFYSKQNLKYYG